eukprot:TRINITY_DN37453_c0_g1_i3.p1 TRINITY_DN37453_c0_g1~~TRINITY_DN37453_c0_g1_i3.p1  ORF type:complete len:1245 (+),score=284.60 TRINITY_DN37453_c0_g1_i3:106-3840(+)
MGAAYSEALGVCPEDVAKESLFFKKLLSKSLEEICDVYNRLAHLRKEKVVVAEISELLDVASKDVRRLLLDRNDISVTELLLVLALLSRTSPQAKSRFVFTVYDREGRGQMDQHVFLDAATALIMAGCRLLRAPKARWPKANSVGLVVDPVFRPHSPQMRKDTFLSVVSSQKAVWELFKRFSRGAGDQQFRLRPWAAVQAAVAAAEAAALEAKAENEAEEAIGSVAISSPMRLPLPPPTPITSPLALGTRPGSAVGTRASSKMDAGMQLTSPSRVTQAAETWQIWSSQGGGSVTASQSLPLQSQTANSRQTSAHQSQHIPGAVATSVEKPTLSVHGYYQAATTPREMALRDQLQRVREMLCNPPMGIFIADLEHQEAALMEEIQASREQVDYASARQDLEKLRKSGILHRRPPGSAKALGGGGAPAQADSRFWTLSTAHVACGGELPAGLSNPVSPMEAKFRIDLAVKEALEQEARLQNPSAPEPRALAGSQELSCTEASSVPENASYAPGKEVLRKAGASFDKSKAGPIREYLQKCLLLGSPWAKYCKKNARCEYMPYTKKVAAGFQEAWNDFAEAVLEEPQEDSEIVSYDGFAGTTPISRQTTLRSGSFFGRGFSTLHLEDDDTRDDDQSVAMSRQVTAMSRQVTGATVHGRGGDSDSDDGQTGMPPRRNERIETISDPRAARDETKDLQSKRLEGAYERLWAADPSNQMDVLNRRASNMSVNLDDLVICRFKYKDVLQAFECFRSDFYERPPIPEREKDDISALTKPKTIVEERNDDIEAILRDPMQLEPFSPQWRQLSTQPMTLRKFLKCIFKNVTQDASQMRVAHRQIAALRGLVDLFDCIDCDRTGFITLEGLERFLCGELATPMEQVMLKEQQRMRKETRNLAVNSQASHEWYIDPSKHPGPAKFVMLAIQDSEAWSILPPSQRSIGSWEPSTPKGKGIGGGVGVGTRSSLTSAVAASRLRKKGNSSSLLGRRTSLRSETGSHSNTPTNRVAPSARRRMMFAAKATGEEHVPDPGDAPTDPGHIMTRGLLTKSVSRAAHAAFCAGLNIRMDNLCKFLDKQSSVFGGVASERGDSSSQHAVEERLYTLMRALEICCHPSLVAARMQEDELIEVPVPPPDEPLSARSEPAADSEEESPGPPKRPTVRKAQKIRLVRLFWRYLIGSAVLKQLQENSEQQPRFLELRADGRLDLVGYLCIMAYDQVVSIFPQDISKKKLPSADQLRRIAFSHPGSGIKFGR